MRTIVLLLIFLNLAFFYWASEYGSKKIVLDNPKEVPGYKPIKLLSELEKETVKKDNPVIVSPPSELESQAKEVVKAQKCFSLGPLETDEQSNTIYDALLGAGIRAKQRTVNQRQPKSYWVYLPAYESQAEAQKVVNFLKANKVNEFYIWLEPPQKNAVSLGLFKKLSTAREKMAQIEELDLKPKMEVRFDEFNEYWIDFNHYDEDHQPKIIEEMLRKNDRMLILETKCS
ncbi:MAG: SPOR domain-containing protein [Gammaproteobacteria bacterium]|nr:SPOR domain-containing protein [Gammaproteobacteria bacterium]